MGNENQTQAENTIIYETFLNQKRLTEADYYEFKKYNRKFTDELYPPNDYSLYSQNSKGEFLDKQNGQKLKDELQENIKEIKWERISDRKEFNQIYNEKVSHEQIRQGNLGDCYLISLIASISHFPKLIIGEKDKNTPHLLYNIEYGDIGYYEIMFFIDGKFKIVIIDDYIPFYKVKDFESFKADFEMKEKYFFKECRYCNNCAFATSFKHYFWVNLLEKAYSKISGGYSNIIAFKNKNQYDHFQVFTGYKSEYYSFYDEKEDKIFINEEKKNSIFQMLEDNLKNDSKKYNIIMTAGTYSENKGIFLEENYMPYRHAFSIIDYETIKINKNKDEMKLLLINNPWGDNVYNGGIGKYCLENLNEDLINLKHYIEYNLNSEDGSFWIDYGSFVKNYYGVRICKIPCNYHCINYSLSNDKHFELPLIYKLKIDKKTNIWFNINIHNTKSIINNDENNKIIKFLVINQVNDEGKVINSFSSVEENDIQVNYDLEKGNYLIWLYIPKKFGNNKGDLKANFGVSSENNININILDYDKDFKYIINICEYLFILNNEKKIKEKKNLMKYLYDFDSVSGLIILFFKNITNNKKIEIVLEVNGYLPIKNEAKIDFRNIKFTLLPNEIKYFIGISNSLKSQKFVQINELKYIKCNERKNESKKYIFSDYITEKNKIDENFDVIKYETNPYCFIKTNFTINKSKRKEEKVINYFVNLMYEKMKQKGLTRERINDISKDIWNKMEEKERNKIRDKLYYQKYEFKKNILTDKILKYFILNNIKLESENSIDVEFEKMKYKSRLSKQFKIVEKDFDYLQEEITNILSDIQYLNEKIEKD